MTVVLLMTGIVLSALTEAVASTALSLARLDMLGDVHATPDEFARLDYGYTAVKLVFFLLAPWLMSRLSAQTCLRAATGAMTLTCGVAALTANLDLLLALRLFQGMTGGVLLVAGQTMLLQAFPRTSQPVVQALYAMGAVVAPATLAPYMQGWLVDSLTWTWIFLAVVPVGLAALALLASTRLGADAEVRAGRFDWVGIALFSVAASCLTYVLNQGSRWDWLEEPFIVNLTIAGVVALVLFVVRQFQAQGEGALMDLSIFRDEGFAFGFLASFAAGFALFGSAYLIPSFAVSVLGMTPTEAGWLLLPSGAMFVGSLLLTAFLVTRVGLPPVLTVPIGILIFMTTMWMLSGSNGESGTPDMMPAILLRGLGLGFLFLSITLITLVGLPRQTVAYGVGLFNLGRQTGGLIGVAFLQTMIDHQVVLNKVVLGASIASGRVAVTERLAMVTRSLTARGMETGEAAQAAVQMLGREVARQATVIAYDTAFLTVALFFLAAAPVLVTSKVIISKIHARQRQKEAQPV
ncbi:DHA2 family efflux MFS transporter permease subunit [Rhizobiaceae bacterium n13]|uniref:DHA2 family efflux MFS transporter permease subunit n=2 Tax=Ferirhizobium litorale TaxID=2927786 RepID=A0AAE3U3D9_9HYPH|nr:DHA2 family efflux MFS transporter permease subunit [Fererhizobium litorale]MDI7925029.1 DHA2 family efflux MFS transporter permease subunit [Fererhizobium litorale]